MEHALLYLSVHVFITVHHMYKVRCYNKDVVFGECGQEITFKNALWFRQPAVNLPCVPFLVFAWGECGTALRTTAQVSLCFQKSSLVKI